RPRVGRAAARPEPGTVAGRGRRVLRRGRDRPARRARCAEPGAGVLRVVAGAELPRAGAGRVVAGAELRRPGVGPAAARPPAARVGTVARLEPVALRRGRPVARAEVVLGAAAGPLHPGLVPLHVAPARPAGRAPPAFAPLRLLRPPGPLGPLRPRLRLAGARRGTRGRLSPR